MQQGLSPRQLRNLVDQQNNANRCFRTRRFRFILFASVSMLASAAFFLVSAYLIWIAVERTAVLFFTAAFFFTESMFFGKYWVGMLVSWRDKHKWHAVRLLVPMIDLVAVLMAAFLESLLIPAGALADLWNQFSTLEPLYFWLLIQILITLSVKTITTTALATMHYRGVIRLASATHRIIDLENFPHTRHVTPEAVPQFHTRDTGALGLDSETRSMWQVEDETEDPLEPMRRLQEILRTSAPTAPPLDQ